VTHTGLQAWEEEEALQRAGVLGERHGMHQEYLREYSGTPSKADTVKTILLSIESVFVSERVHGKL